MGLSEAALRAAQPTPANQALMDWCDMSSQDRNWREALAVHVACECHFNTMRRIRSGLANYYGLSPTEAELWEIHAGRVERAHAREGLALLARHVAASEMDSIGYYFEFTVRLVCAFHDSILEA